MQPVGVPQAAARRGQGETKTAVREAAVFLTMGGE